MPLVQFHVVHRTPVRAALAGLFVIYVLSVSGRIGNSDAASMLEVTRSLLSGNLSVPETVGHVIGFNGQPYCHYGLLPSLLWIPFVVLGNLVHSLWPIVSEDYWQEFFVSFSNAFVVIAILRYMAWEWERLGLDHKRIAKGLCLFGLTTILWPYSKLPMSDPLMALGLFGAYCHWQRSDKTKHALLSGLWLGAALLSRKQAQALIPLFLLIFLWVPTLSNRFRRCVLLGVGFLPLIIVYLLYNYARWGSPVVEKYAGSEPLHLLSFDVLIYRVLGVCFGEYSGIFIFNVVLLPLLFIAGKKWIERARASFYALSIIAFIHVVFIAHLPYWTGEICFGARFFLFLIPFIALGYAFVPPVLGRISTLLLYTAVLLGFSIQVLGVTTDPLAAFWRRELYLSPTSYILTAHSSELLRAIGIDKTPPPMDRPHSKEYWNHQAFQVPDLWWCHAAYIFCHRNSSSK